ncbi:hypothetical protein AURDEDRAFT_153806, partial [Auricularia subglabra TFB-10046 SS5]
LSAAYRAAIVHPRCFSRALRVVNGPASLNRCLLAGGASAEERAPFRAVSVCAVPKLPLVPFRIPGFCFGF